MFSSLQYTFVDGDKKEKKIVVYALSTCGFCKRAMQFLNTNKYAYHYIHLDLIDIQVKNQIKKELADQYHENVAFPYAVLDDTETLVGFVEADWKKKLGLA